MRSRFLRKPLARWKKQRHARAIGRGLPVLVALVLQALVVLYGAYVVGVNGALYTGLAERIANQSPDKFLFEFESAYSFWPGSVHAKHFLFRGQDSVVQWRIELDDATAHFALTELFDKRLHMTTGEANGASVRIRLKIDAKDAGSEAAKMLPPIPGFSDPPILGPPVPDPPDDAYPYFTFIIENGTAENVREVWFNTFHVTDMLDVHGGFYLKPNRRVEVMPATVHLKDATVQEGSTVITEHLRGSIDAHVEGFDPRVPSGREILAYVDAKTDVTGSLHGLEFLNLHLVGQPIGFAGGGGPFYAAVDVLHGKFKPGSRVKARFEGWQVFSAPHRVTGTTTADARVDHASEASGSFETYDLHLHRGTKSDLEILEVPVLGVLARTKSVDVSQPIADWALSVDAPAGKVPNVAVLNMYANKPLFVGGNAAFSGHVDATDQQARARGRATFADTTVVLADRQFRAAGSVALWVSNLNLNTGRGDLTGTTVEVHDFVYGTGKGEASWWARATIGPGEVGLQSGTLALTLSGKARDAKPFWSVLKVPGWVAGLLGGDALTVAGNVRLGPSLFEIPHMRAVGNDFDVQARYRARGPNKKGVAFLRRGPVTAGIEIDGDNVSVRPLASEAWFRGAEWGL
jgi:hypothetical protein